VVVFNSQLLKKVMDQVKNPDLIKINRIKDQKIASNVANKDLSFDFITVRKKGFVFFKFPKS